MKLLRFAERRKEKPGIIQNDKWFDVSQFVKDYDEDFLQMIEKISWKKLF